MPPLKQRLKRWFNENFDLIREGQSSWLIQPKSCLGSCLCCLLFLPLLLICLGYTIFVIFKIYPIVFSTVITRLGISPGLGLPLLIAAFFGCFINLPPTRSHPYDYVGINVSGGVIPIILALYQFHRVQPLGILIVTAIVALISYFLVAVIPGTGIFFTWPRMWLITTVAALSAMAFVAGGVNRFDVSVAFAGGVLGTTIGADLLHLKDVRPELAVTRLNIGGAGSEDGIVKCGLGALVIAEWLPAAIAWLSDYFR